jgi:hypothetical protein
MRTSIYAIAELLRNTTEVENAKIQCISLLRAGGMHPEFFIGGGGWLDWPWDCIEFMFDFKNYVIKIMS